METNQLLPVKRRNRRLNSRKDLSLHLILPFTKTKPRKPHSSTGATLLFFSLTWSRSSFLRNLRILAITRVPALRLFTIMMKSSAYLTKWWPRLSSSLSRSSRRILASSGESGPPYAKQILTSRLPFMTWMW